MSEQKQLTDKELAHLKATKGTDTTDQIINKEPLVEGKGYDPVTGKVYEPAELPEFVPPAVKISEVNINAVNAVPPTEEVVIPKDEFAVTMPHTKEVKLEPDEIEEEIEKAKTHKKK